MADAETITVVPTLSLRLERVTTMVSSGLGFDIPVDRDIDGLHEPATLRKGQRPGGEFDKIASGGGGPPGDGVVHGESRVRDIAGDLERQRHRARVALRDKGIRDADGRNDHTPITRRAQVRGGQDGLKSAVVAAGGGGVARVVRTRGGHPDERCGFRPATGKARVLAGHGGRRTVFQVKPAPGVGEVKELVTVRRRRTKHRRPYPGREPQPTGKPAHSPAGPTRRGTRQDQPR